MSPIMFARNLPESVIKTYSIRVRAVGGVNLGQGIPSFSTAKPIIDEVKKALDQDPYIGVYPNFMGEIWLREAIAGRLNHEYRLKLSENENILVTVGAMEAVSAGILSVIDEGEKVGVITPDYCNHFPVVTLAKCEIVEVPMQEGDSWTLDLEKVEEAAKAGVKLLVFTNPNNPTGAVYSRKQMSELVQIARKFDMWLAADETYAFLDYEGRFSSLLEHWQEYERLLVVRSFSKEFAMTGWRVGFLAGNAATVKIISKTHDALVGCAPKISQYAAYAAIEHRAEIVPEYVETLARRRHMVCKLLDELGDEFIYTKPQGAYYIFPRFMTKITSMELSEKMLEKAQVALVPGAVFGQAGESHIRISFAVEDKVLQEGMTQLKRYFTEV